MDPRHPLRRSIIVGMTKQSRTHPRCGSFNPSRCRRPTDLERLFNFDLLAIDQVKHTRRKHQPFNRRRPIPRNRRMLRILRSRRTEPRKQPATAMRQTLQMCDDMRGQRNYESIACPFRLLRNESHNRNAGQSHVRPFERKQITGPRNIRYTAITS